MEVENLHKKVALGPNKLIFSVLGNNLRKFSLGYSK